LRLGRARLLVVGFPSRIIEPKEGNEMVMKKTKFQPRGRLMGKLASYLRPRFLVATILLVIAMSAVSEADCWDDSLKRVDKDIIVMASGAIYRVVPRDAMNSAFWLPPTNTTICDAIADVGGAQMTYFQIFNRDLAVSVWAERER
jgi:hypothetical protein